MSLKGKVVAITRPAEDAQALVRLVRRYDGKPYVAPTIEVLSPKSQNALTAFIERFLDKPHDFVVFMSKNGIRNLFWTAERYQLSEKLRTRLNSSFILVVGPTTAKELDKFGIRSHRMPEEFSSRGLVKFFRKLDIKNRRICLFRADKVTDFLKKNLTELGASIDEVAAYRVSVPRRTHHIRRLIENMLAGKIDIITFTSSATVRNLFEIAQKRNLSSQLRKTLNKKTVVAIGPVTAKTLQDFEVSVTVMPSEHTVEAMMNALITYLGSS